MYSRSLRATPSQETLISLMQLDPSPIEADTDKELPPLPEDMAESTGSVPSTTTAATTTTAAATTTSRVRTSSLGLSGAGHGSVYYLTRIQRYSTYALSIFTGLHLANTSLIPLVTRSVPASESYLLLAREIYQTPACEPLLVALPIAAHLASGLALRLVRRSQNLARYGGATPGVVPLRHAHHHPRGGGPGSGPGSGSGYSSPTARRRAWPPLSWTSLSGYGFALFLGAHVFMNRVLPLHVEGDSANIGLAYVAHGFARHPASAYAAFAGLLALGCGHMAWGWAQWVGLAQLAGWSADLKSVGSTRNREEDARRRRRRRRVWLWVNGAAVAATAVWAAGGLGVVAKGGPTLGWVGRVYDDLYKTVGM